MEWEIFEGKGGKLYAYNKETQEAKIASLETPPDTAEFWKDFAFALARELYGDEGEDDEE